MHVQELARLGARIHLDGERATIEGVERLKGAPVMATDLRVGALRASNFSGTITPSSDTVYKLGGGGGYLTLSGVNALAAGNSLIVSNSGNVISRPATASTAAPRSIAARSSFWAAAAPARTAPSPVR